MLNRSRLLRELQLISGQLFTDLSGEFSVARASWERIISDATFLYKIKGLQTSTPLPTWDNKIDECFLANKPIEAYEVIAIDGSQIYPDRHQGTSCFLINIGTVILRYGIPDKSVELDSVPYVFLGDEDKNIEHVSADYINLRREEFEFEAGLALAQQLQNSHTSPSLLLLDGSIIFWYLEGKDPELRNQFLTRYFSALYNMYEKQIINASYISLPRSKELVNLLKVELSNGNLDKTESYESISHILDVHIANLYLQPGERTTLFKHNSKITSFYPKELQPYFYYLHTGFEIARIEVPAWIAHNESTIETISRIIYDQSTKGRGYPIALAEAHEQAVVKGPDREFFYHLITKLGMNVKHRPKISHKMMKKRSLGI